MLIEILAEFFHKMNKISFENIIKIPGLGQVTSKRKTCSTTPDGKRRRSELEKILAKNAYYKKLDDDREVASKQFPIPEAKTKTDEHLKPSNVEINDFGKFMASIF